MVFPSPGCQTCRKRRVKCDSTRPTCGRCGIGKRDCTWDSDEQTGLHFRSENAFAQGRPRRPRPRRSNVASSPLRAANSTPEALLCLATRANASKKLVAPDRPRPALSLPLDVHTLNFYAWNFLSGENCPVDVGQEFWPFVLSYWNSSPPDSSLRLALTAYSHALFGQRRGVRDSICSAKTAYVKAIARTQLEVADLSVGDVDHILLAMMLMGHYENIMFAYRRPATQTPADEVGSRLWEEICHPKGASGLMSSRREPGVAPNPELRRAIRRQCLRIIMIRGAPMPPWLDGGAKWGEEGPALALDALMARALVLRNSSIPLFRESRSPALALDLAGRLAEEATVLGEDLLSWPSTLPGEWKVTVIAPSSVAGGYAGRPVYRVPWHTYSSTAHATMWNRYRALRLIVSSIRRRSLGMLMARKQDCPATQEGIVDAERGISDAADEMCGGVQFFFAHHNGAASNVDDEEPFADIPAGQEMPAHLTGLLSWPLAVGVSTEGVPSLQRDWMRARLRAIARWQGDTVLELVAGEGEFKF